MRPLPSSSIRLARDPGPDTAGSVIAEIATLLAVHLAVALALCLLLDLGSPT